MKGRPHILVLDNSVATTGAYRSALAMAQALNGQVDTTFVLPPADDLHAELGALGFHAHPLPMVEIGRSLRRLLAYVPMLVINGVRLRKLLYRGRIDVLVANDYYNLLPIVVRLMGWRGRTITIVRLLPAGQQPLLNRIWIAAMRWTSDSVLAVSRAVAAQLPASLHARVLYFPVGRGLESVPFLPATDRGEAKVEFLYLANYIPGKGQLNALRAFAAILPECPAARLRFAGGDMGLAKNAAYREAIAAEALRLGVEGHVDFNGAVEDVVSAIQQADVVLNFSESESFSHTCVEAGLLGRPVIATRCGGPEEIVEDGTTGLLVACGDVGQMAAAMKTLANEPVLRTGMGYAAWERTRERFGGSGFAAKMLRLIVS